MTYGGQHSEIAINCGIIWTSTVKYSFQNPKTQGAKKTGHWPVDEKDIERQTQEQVIGPSFGVLRVTRDTVLANVVPRHVSPDAPAAQVRD